MRDRVTLYPGRVDLIPVPGHPNRFDIEMADEPVENGEGTPPIKKYLLQDLVAEALGLEDFPESEDDFASVSNAIFRLIGLAGSGGGGKTHLKHMQIDGGKFTNAGSGWQSLKFGKRTPAPSDKPYFNGVPAVGAWVIGAQDARSVEITNVTVDGFQYQVRPAVVTAFQMVYIAIFDGGKM